MIDNFNEKFLAYARTRTGPYHPSADLRECALGQFVATQGFIGHGSSYSAPDDMVGHNWIDYPGEAYYAAVRGVDRDLASSCYRGKVATWERLVERMEAVMADPKLMEARNAAA